MLTVNINSPASGERVSTDADLPHLKSAVDIFSRKWNPQVLYVIYHIEPVQYGEIANELDISSKMLSKTLSELLDRGLILRYEDEDEQHVLYTTAPQGGELVHRLEGLVRWQKQQHGELKILLVEDDKMAAKLLADQIGDIVSEGYTLYQEPTVEEAKEHVSTGLDYVLLDRRLPGGKQGDELVRAVKSECRSCMIMIVSGVAPDRKLLRLDTDDYVVKPVDRDELAAHIESIEARRGLTDVKREYLATRSKQAAFLDAYGRAAEARPEYRLLTEIIERLPLDEATRTALESMVPAVTE